MMQAASILTLAGGAAASQCLGDADSYGHDPTCLPSWKPTYDMKRSTVLYTCNNTGMHNVEHAVEYGTVVYDWSNAKKIWANANPMSSEELITKQAEMVLAADPGVEGYNPRVWAYRNTIKALNWYSSVREKLDDPKYSSWFIKFKGFDDKAYPGGKRKDSSGKDTNGTFHVPTCDWYGTADKPAKCSGFYHDQEQTPEKAAPGGGSCASSPSALPSVTEERCTSLCAASARCRIPGRAGPSTRD